MKQSSLFLKGIVWLSINTVLLVLLAWLVLMIAGFTMQACGAGYLFVDTLNDSMNSLVNYLTAFPHLLEKRDAILQLLALPNIDMSSLVSHEVSMSLNFQSSLFDSILSTFYVYLGIIVLTIQFTVLKVLTLINMLFLLVWFVFLALFDGLVARSLRRYEGIRESALIYHQSKKLASMTYYFSILLFLILPFNVTPITILLPTFLVISFFVWLTTKQFKKYL